MGEREARAEHGEQRCARAEQVLATDAPGDRLGHHRMERPQAGGKRCRDQTLRRLVVATRSSRLPPSPRDTKDQRRVAQMQQQVGEVKTPCRTAAHPRIDRPAERDEGNRISIPGRGEEVLQPRGERMAGEEALDNVVAVIPVDEGEADHGRQGPDKQPRDQHRKDPEGDLPAHAPGRHDNNMQRGGCAPRGFSNSPAMVPRTESARRERQAVAEGPSAPRRDRSATTFWQV